MIEGETIIVAKKAGIPTTTANEMNVYMLEVDSSQNTIAVVVYQNTYKKRPPLREKIQLYYLVRCRICSPGRVLGKSKN